MENKLIMSIKNNIKKHMSREWMFLVLDDFNSLLGMSSTPK